MATRYAQPMALEMEATATRRAPRMLIRIPGGSSLSNGQTDHQWQPNPVSPLSPLTPIKSPLTPIKSPVSPMFELPKLRRTPVPPSLQRRARLSTGSNLLLQTINECEEGVTSPSYTSNFPLSSPKTTTSTTTLPSPGPAISRFNKEIIYENVRLESQATLLERSEHEMRTRNQALRQSLLDMQKEEDEYQLQCDREMREMEAKFEARVKELEKRATEQQERIRELTEFSRKAQPLAIPQSLSSLLSVPAARTSTPAPIEPAPAPSTATLPPLPRPPMPTLLDTDISAWFASSGNSWYEWAEDFAHMNPSRIAALSATQQHELCNGVKSFVRLTSDGKLPPELLSAGNGASGSGGSISTPMTPLFPGEPSAPSARPSHTARLLLHGMLSNYVVTEILASPFWVFSALPKTGTMTAANGPGNGLGPFGHGNASNLPPPYSPLGLSTSSSLLSPRLGGHFGGGGGGFSFPATLSSRQETEIPAEHDIRRLCALLSHAQQTNDLSNRSQVQTWLSHLLRILLSEGLDQDVTYGVLLIPNKRHRKVAQARREYARTLKERFLGGAARFLLRDQDEDVSIERLERRLLNELDSALRFSARMWCQSCEAAGTGGVPRFLGLGDFASAAAAAAAGGGGSGEKGRRVKFRREVMEKCPLAQGRMTLYGTGERDGEQEEVIMVVQPAVVGAGSSNGLEFSKVWAKAQVLGGGRAGGRMHEIGV